MIDGRVEQTGVPVINGIININIVVLAEDLLVQKDRHWMPSLGIIIVSGNLKHQQQYGRMHLICIRLDPTTTNHRPQIAKGAHRCTLRNKNETWELRASASAIAVTWQNWHPQPHILAHDRRRLCTLNQGERRMTISGDLRRRQSFEQALTCSRRFHMAVARHQGHIESSSPVR